MLKYHLHVKTSAAVLPNIMKNQSAAAGELQYGCQREGDINWKHRKRNLSRAALYIRAVNVHRLPVFIKLAELTSESGSHAVLVYYPVTMLHASWNTTNDLTSYSNTNKLVAVSSTFKQITKDKKENEDVKHRRPVFCLQFHPPECST